MKEELIEEVVNKYGSPVYVFDIQEVKRRIRYLKSLLPEGVLLCFAIKANTFIVKEVEDEIDRLEVCSPGEYEICKERGVDSRKILVSGVYKTPDVIKDMVLHDTDIGYYTIESMEQFRLLKDLSKNHKLKIMIRITSGNQFGINFFEAEDIIKNRADYPNSEIEGLQYFAGTQRGSSKLLKKELDRMDNFIEELESNFGFITKELEFGPGFPVHYFEDDEFDEEGFIKAFSENLKSLKFKGKVILELGRSIAASCGTYITRVVDKKVNKNQNYALLDGGINHIVYYGQSMAMKIPKCKVLPKRENISGEKWNLCGSLCTINDILVKQFPCRRG